MRVTAIRAKTERKRQDKSARYAEKRRRRAGMLRVYGSIRPTTGVCATTDPRSGRKTLDQVAQSGDPDVKWQATWGMSGHAFFGKNRATARHCVADAARCDFRRRIAVCDFGL